MRTREATGLNNNFQLRKCKLRTKQNRIRAKFQDTSDNFSLLPSFYLFHTSRSAYRGSPAAVQRCSTPAASSETAVFYVNVSITQQCTLGSHTLGWKSNLLQKSGLKNKYKNTGFGVWVSLNSFKGGLGKAQQKHNSDTLYVFYHNS